MSGPRTESSKRRKYNQPRNFGNIYKPRRKSEKYRLGQEVNFAYQITKNWNNKPSSYSGYSKTETIISSSWEDSLKQFFRKAICQYVKKAWKTFILCSFMQKKKYRKDNKKTKLIGYLWMEKGHKEGKRERNSREEKEWHFSEYIYAFPIGWVSETYNALHITPAPQINE